jgi:DNA modification methylase
MIYLSNKFIKTRKNNNDVSLGDYNMEKSNTKIIDRLDLGPLVTFIPNKELPIYNWFHFKEGFSRDFVHIMINRFELDSNNWVLDPFLGSGTTLLACKERGINGIGIEINPLFLFIADAKLTEYNIEKIRFWVEWLFKKKFVKPDLSGISGLVKRSFNIHNLEDIIFFRDQILEIEDTNTRKFLMMALLRAASKVTYAYKDGAVIKIIKKHTPPFRPFYRRIIQRMIEDIKKIEFKSSRIHIYLGDSRNMDMVEDEAIDAVITSPPYLNKIEYTRVYEIEMELFLEDIKIDPLRSYIGIIPRKRPRDMPDILRDKNLPPAANYYFIDMWRVLKEIYRVMKKNAKGALVLSDGIFPDRIVETHKIIEELATHIGFKVPEIWIVNRRVATRNRTKKLGVAKETIIFINK